MLVCFQVNFTQIWNDNLCFGPRKHLLKYFMNNVRYFYIHNEKKREKIVWKSQKIPYGLIHTKAAVHEHFEIEFSKWIESSGNVSYWIWFGLILFLSLQESYFSIRILIICFARSFFSLLKCEIVDFNLSA